jgi:uncharacterized protein
LRARGVAHAALFGSRVRGDNRPDSDTDIMIEVDPDAHITVFDHAGFKVIEMDRTAVITKLKEHEAELKQLGVEHLYLFGSTARGEASEDSDVDLFFDHPVGSLGLFELMDVKDAAGRILGRKTDIMTRRSLHPVLRERIEASALQVF